MFRKIAGTAGVRLINAILSFVVVIIATRNLGAEGYGTITLVILGITLIQLVNNIAGGSALVYLIPREDTFRLFILSNVWALITAAVGANLLAFFSLIPPEYRRDTLLLSLLMSCSTVNLMILLGKERIRAFNILTIVQVGTTLLALAFFFYLKHLYHPDYYIVALYIAYGTTYLAGIISIRSYLVFSDLSEITGPLKKILHYGGLMQLAAIIQFFNYRLGYYLVEHYYDKSMLGKFAVGVQMAEGMWLIAKSVALIQYSRISNEPDNPAYALRITLLFLKFTFISTLLLLLLILLIPSTAFTMLFGPDFGQVRVIIFSLSPGILFVAVSQILSHYFSGTGKPQHNTISSGIGFTVIVVAGFTLIPWLGLIGAGIACSLSYLAILIYQLYWFKAITKIKNKELIITKTDINRLINEVKSIFSDAT